MKKDHPRLTAQYIVDKNMTRSQQSDRNLQWAKHTLCNLQRAVHHVARLYNFFLDDNDEVYRVGRVQKGGNKKKQQYYSKPVFKYGVQVPQTV
jgi:hypothetical protein